MKIKIEQVTCSILLSQYYLSVRPENCRNSDEAFLISVSRVVHNRMKRYIVIAVKIGKAVIMTTFVPYIIVPYYRITRIFF